MGQKFAAFDALGKIIGFYDSIDSPLPSGKNAIPINDHQWKQCLTTPGGFVVKDKKLTVNTEPVVQAVPQTLEQKAQMILNSGVDVVCETIPGISSTYPLDQKSLSRLTTISMYIQLHGAFPNNQTTISVLDVKKNPHVFPNKDIFDEFAKAVIDYAFALESIDANSTEVPVNLIKI